MLKGLLRQGPKPRLASDDILVLICLGRGVSSFLRLLYTNWQNRNKEGVSAGVKYSMLEEGEEGNSKQKQKGDSY